MFSVHWPWITLAYCAYLAAVSFLRPEFTKARRALVLAVVIASLMAILPVRVWANTPAMVILPSLALLAGYRLSGLLFVRVDLAIENALLGVDRTWLHRTGLIQGYARSPRMVREFLEASYLLVYAALPAGAVTIIATHHASALDAYWSVVLLAEFLCYGCLPWIQTRPPMLRPEEAETLPPATGVRTFNQAIARGASIRANTIPSGHAAGAMAAALFLLPWTPLGIPFLVLAISIAVASVLGRYHYAVDSVLGILVALFAWALVT